MCHVVGTDSLAIKFGRAEVAFFLALFCWLKPLTVEGEEETGVNGEKDEGELWKMPILKPEFQAPMRLEPAP